MNQNSTRKTSFYKDLSSLYSSYSEWDLQSSDDEDDLQFSWAGLHKPLIICGPSSVGKGTIISWLKKHYSEKFSESISHTTRKRRPAEAESVDFHFVSRSEFEAAVWRGEFVESEEVYGNLYGTSIQALKEVSRSGKVCLIGLHVSSAVRAIEEGLLDANLVFIEPPSLEALKKRLRGRGTEDEESLNKRISSFQEEIGVARGSRHVTRIVVNNKLEEFKGEMSTIVESLYPHLAK